MNKLLVQMHEVWLEMFMSQFMSKNLEASSRLSDFSQIIFRHFTWIEHECINLNIEYDYERNQIPIKVDSLKNIIHNISNRLRQIELSLIQVENMDLKSRISTDIEYILYNISTLEDEIVYTFNTNMQLNNISISQDATDALIFFLFEESYKEYELIMIYNYLKAHSKDIELSRIFGILIEESFFHLKKFSSMMGEMGILGIPRVVPMELYKITDLTKFLKDGIDEEIAAKEECRKLSLAVGNESKELAKLFDFINYQENYHVALMKDALKSIGENNV